MNKEELHNFLQKSMTRKEFVRHVGLMLLSVFGAGALLRYLGQNNFVPQKSPNGYGSSAFGGKGKKYTSQRSS